MVIFFDVVDYGPRGYDLKDSDGRRLCEVSGLYLEKVQPEEEETGPTVNTKEILALREIFPNATIKELADGIFAVKKCHVGLAISNTIPYNNGSFKGATPALVLSGRMVSIPGNLAQAGAGKSPRPEMALLRLGRPKTGYEGPVSAGGYAGAYPLLHFQSLQAQDGCTVNPFSDVKPH